MMIMKKVLFCFILICSFSCNQKNDETTKQRELDLKERELNLKEKEIEVLTIQKKATMNKSSESKTLSNLVLFSNIEYLYGTWLCVSNPSTFIKFTRDGKFSFIDNTNNSTDELMGNFELDSGKILMLYDDRHKQTFKFIKDLKNNRLIVFHNENYIFIKAN